MNNYMYLKNQTEDKWTQMFSLPFLPLIKDFKKKRDVFIHIHVVQKITLMCLLTFNIVNISKFS